MKLSGLLIVDKPSGITSRHVVDRVEKIVKPQKVGHAGTLDPLATGVLVVCVGTATRLISHVQDGRKRYVGRFELGARSNTDDSDGEIEIGGDWSQIDRHSIESLLPGFIGTVMQTPPQVSAVKIDGHRAYKLARRGATFDIKPRPVEIYSLTLTRFEPPYFDLDIECGSGTYIRSIGRDLGERLQCGAIMTSLRRERVSSFGLDHAISLDAVNAQSILDHLQPPLSAVAHLPKYEVTSFDITWLRNGRSIPKSRDLMTPEVEGPTTDAAEIVLVDEFRNLIGLAREDHIQKLLHPKLIVPMS